MSRVFSDEGLARMLAGDARLYGRSLAFGVEWGGDHGFAGCWCVTGVYTYPNGNQATFVIDVYSTKAEAEGMASVRSVETALG
jgi:hypothetical protein